MIRLVFYNDEMCILKITIFMSQEENIVPYNAVDTSHITLLRKTRIEPFTGL